MTGRHVMPGSEARGAGKPVDQCRLAAAFVEFADTLAEDFDPIEFLYTLVDRCMELLDLSAVGLMLGDGHGRLRVVAASSEETRLLELFQLQNDQGPCLECYHSGQPVDEPDLEASRTRWPLFSPEAVRAGFRTVHALPMRLREQSVGSMNLFHHRAGGLSEPDITIAQALVDVATIGLIWARDPRREILADQLQAALDTRVVIEQAKGVLAERRNISPAEAFTVLRRHARSGRHRLTDLAYAVIEDGATSSLLIAEDARSPSIRRST